MGYVIAIKKNALSGLKKQSTHTTTQRKKKNTPESHEMAKKSRSENYLRVSKNNSSKKSNSEAKKGLFMRTSISANIILEISHLLDF